MSLLFVGMPGTGSASLPANAGADEVLVAATTALAEQQAAGRIDGVLVVSPVEHARASEIARAVSGHPGVAHTRPTGPTTQLALAAAVLLRHSELTPSDALAVLQEVPRHVTTRAVLGSVTGLGSPRPTIWQHVASWAPWTRFWVDTTAGTVASATSSPTSAHTYLSSTLDPGADPRLVADDLLPPGADPLPPLDSAIGDRWGTRRFVERSYLTTPPAEVVDAALSVPALPCANCDRPTRAARCDFCGVVRADRKVSA